MFMMADLKAELENIAMKMINKINVKELCSNADKFRCRSLLSACAQFMVKEGVCLDGEEVKKMPDATAACMEAFKLELEKKKNMEVRLEEGEGRKKSLEVRLRKVEDQLAVQEKRECYDCSHVQAVHCDNCEHCAYCNNCGQELY